MSDEAAADDETVEGDGDEDLVVEDLVVAAVGGEGEARAPVHLSDGHRGGHLAVLAFDAAGRPALLEHAFVVENECHGWRLDRFLMKRMRRLSRARIQRVIHGDLDIGSVKVTRPAARVQAGQVVRFRRPAPVEPDVPRNVGVLLADPEVYALDKPAGLPIHPTARYHYSTLTAVLRERFPGERLEMCHRLDRETSGVLLVGRTPTAGPLIKRAFAKRQIEKTYLAICHGDLASETVVDAPLGLDGGRVRIKMAIRAVAQGGLVARTRFVPLARFAGFTLVEAHPETGRQHQIRAHLDHIGHPIVGDKLYPHEERFIEWADHGMSDELLADLTLPRHALHAAALVFPHPVTGERIRVESPLPDDLVAHLATLQPLG